MANPPKPQGPALAQHLHVQDPRLFKNVEKDRDAELYRRVNAQIVGGWGKTLGDWQVVGRTNSAAQANSLKYPNGNYKPEVLAGGMAPADADIKPNTLYLYQDPGTNNIFFAARDKAGRVHKENIQAHLNPVLPNPQTPQQVAFEAAVRTGQPVDPNFLHGITNTPPHQFPIDGAAAAAVLAVNPPGALQLELDTFFELDPNNLQNTSPQDYELLKNYRLYIDKNGSVSTVPPPPDFDSGSIFNRKEKNAIFTATRTQEIMAYQNLGYTSFEIKIDRAKAQIDPDAIIASLKETLRIAEDLGMRPILEADQIQLLLGKNSYGSPMFPKAEVAAILKHVQILDDAYQAKHQTHAAALGQEQFVDQSDKLWREVGEAAVVGGAAATGLYAIRDDLQGAVAPGAVNLVQVTQGVTDLTTKVADITAKMDDLTAHIQNSYDVQELTNYRDMLGKMKGELEAIHTFLSTDSVPVPPAVPGIKDLIVNALNPGGGPLVPAVIAEQKKATDAIDKLGDLQKRADGLEAHAQARIDDKQVIGYRR